MRHQICSIVFMVSLLSTVTACRQAAPIPNPLSALAPAHVPPPATGSYQIPDQYSNGQVSRQSNASTAKIAANDQAIGSGVVQSSYSNTPSGSTNNSIQWGNDLSGYRGSNTATAGQPAVAHNVGPLSQEETDGPPAPQMNNYPSTSELNWQSPGQP
ncbi:MAG: hypothetical protein R3C05_26490 [Pirellulaceae bacterium]